MGEAENLCTSMFVGAQSNSEESKNQPSCCCCCHCHSCCCRRRRCCYCCPCGRVAGLLRRLKSALAVFPRAMG